MFKLLPAIKDAYVTNRVVNGVRQLGANVGSAGSLDLFKLYGATTSGSVPNVELSRLLIQFDLSALRAAVAAGQIDTNATSFSCRLHLFDVYGGQPCPRNFTVAVNPMSASFDEGLGRDVVFYSDGDVCNWLSGSASGAWFVSGCGLGAAPSSPCDYVNTMKSMQVFVTGEEDLDVDVTAIVSSTLAGAVPDVGLRISLDVPLEGDQHTYFVKRFASRTAFNTDLRPALYVRFDDSVQDDTDNATLDQVNYLFMYNYVRSTRANLASGSSAVTGHNSLALTLNGAFPRANPSAVSSSVVYQPAAPFIFRAGSNLLFSGQYTLTGSPGVATNSQLVGYVSGTFPSASPKTMSGSFVLSSGLPALSGPATFSGTLDGIAGLYSLTGTYLPDGAFLLSGTYAISSTMEYVSYTAGPFSASQLFFGSQPQVGIYSASVALSSTDPDLAPQWQHSGSVSLVPVWGSIDGTVAYLTGSAITFNPPTRGPRNFAPRRFEVTVLGVREAFACNERTVLRINIFDYTQSYVSLVGRLPVELPGLAIRDVHYQVRDVATGRIAIPFDTVYNSTRASNDTTSMYFELDTSNLTQGHSYTVDVMVVTAGNTQLYKSASPTFRVDVAK